MKTYELLVTKTNSKRGDNPLYRDYYQDLKDAQNDMATLKDHYNKEHIQVSALIIDKTA